MNSLHRTPACHTFAGRTEGMRNPVWSGTADELLSLDFQLCKSCGQLTAAADNALAAYVYVSTRYSWMGRKLAIIPNPKMDEPICFSKPSGTVNYRKCKRSALTMGMIQCTRACADQPNQLQSGFSHSAEITGIIPLTILLRAQRKTRRSERVS